MAHLAVLYYLEVTKMEYKKVIAFICPLSDEGSQIRTRSDDIMENIIEPVATELHYSVLRADKLSGSVIMEDIIAMLHDADIVIADLTDMNPNVFYELGLRQASKGKCINIICNSTHAKLPFDISYYRAHHYTINGNYGSTLDFQRYIRERIHNLEKAHWDPKMTLDTKDLIEVHNVTVVNEFLKGAKNHYLLAKDLFNIQCKSIFLMQRSSSLILNAEQGWGEEDDFLQRLKCAIDECGFFYHIITLEGIEAHLKRKNSVFPNFQNFSENVENREGRVAIKKENKKNDKTFYIKKLPVDSQDSLFKLDRQSRVLITEDIRGNVKAVVVQNLGTDQTCFLIQGPKAKDYLNACIDYYNECEFVKWTDIVRLYKNFGDCD
jgi:hypothetical protein